jgi:hypothetical protein
MKNQVRKPLESRLRWLDSFEKYPLSYFKNDSEAWKKLDHFFKTHGPFLNMNLDSGLFVAGGSVVRAVMGNSKTSDIDLWACGLRPFEEAKKFFDQRAIANASAVNVTKQYAPVYCNVDSLDVQVCGMPDDFNVQDVLSSFDFFNSMFATDGRDVLMATTGRQSVIENRIIINQDTNRPYQAKIQERIAKYREMGFAAPESSTIPNEAPTVITGYTSASSYWGSGGY